MHCPKCQSTRINERPEHTAQGYRRFRCLDCAKQFNERGIGRVDAALGRLLAFVSGNAD